MFAHILLATAVLSFLAAPNERTVSDFHPPIDALSITLPNATAIVEVRGWDGEMWTQWFSLAVEEEFDPLLRESNLVIFPRPVSRIELSSNKSVTPSVVEERHDYAHHDTIALHPIRIPKDPVHILTASRYTLPAHRILSRKEWGADDTFLFTGDETLRSDIAPERAVDTIENGNGVIPERLRECEEWQRQFPGEFRAERSVREDAAGQRYRWPLQYSPSVQLLVVHHTAQNVTGDERPPLERVRALYAYHANSRGWGDIGYHYLIDERGQIYEGRSGGKGVIGGHAYCWNTGTVSIAMLGNFDIEQPTQAQMQSLQWLLADMVETYDLDLGSSVRMHGKTFPAIVGHRDLLSTDCPGYYVRETLAQVRENVWKKNLFAIIRFPRPILARRLALPLSLQLSALVPRSSEPLLTPMGITQLQGRPGSVLPLGLQYRNGKKSVPQFATIAAVEADRGIHLWQERGKRFVPVTGELRIPGSLPAKEQIDLRLKIQFPTSPGEFRLNIGPIRYTLLVAGKRAAIKTTVTAAPIPQITNRSALFDTTSSPQRCHTGPCVIPSVVEGRSATPRAITMTRDVPIQTRNGPTIRIRLTFPSDTAIVLLPDDALLSGIPPNGREVLLFRDTDACTAKERGKNIASGIVRIAGNGPFAITNGKSVRRYSGTLECRIIDGVLTLINELPLEDYLVGVAEEPDTEQPEKQQAFAIAARSYAAHYINQWNHPGSASFGTTTGQRKFPGMPYDGSDDPALFQAYEGLTFAERNPTWVRAVRDTAGQVLMKDNEIIRAAYFSSDDGRTRSPEEVGWANFPHAEVFTSKQDPWCEGKPNAGHGVGMSGCGARGQAEEGKTAEEILRYYYPGTVITQWENVSP